MDNQNLEEVLAASVRASKAMALFKEGYNCSQSVLLAFEDVHGLDRKTAVTLSSSFGGGMGRLREVCGGMSGVFMVLGLVYGSEEPMDVQTKKEQYERVQECAAEFKAIHGSIVCRELLGLDIKGADSPTPEARTPEYYQKRPCPQMIGSAALILERYLDKYPL